MENSGIKRLASFRHKLMSTYIHFCNYLVLSLASIFSVPWCVCVCIVMCVVLCFVFKECLEGLPILWCPFLVWIKINY